MNQLRAKIGYYSQSESNNENYAKENCFESLNQFINSGNADNLNVYRKSKKMKE